ELQQLVAHIAFAHVEDRHLARKGLHLRRQLLQTLLRLGAALLAHDVTDAEPFGFRRCRHVEHRDAPAGRARAPCRETQRQLELGALIHHHQEDAMRLLRAFHVSDPVQALRKTVPAAQPVDTAISTAINPYTAEWVWAKS